MSKFVSALAYVIDTSPSLSNAWTSKMSKFRGINLSIVWSC